MRALIAMVAIWGATTGGVRVTGKRLPDCISTSRIEAALVPIAGNRAGSLELEATGAWRLAVKLHVGELVAERSLSLAPDECAEAERTITLLVTAWLSPRDTLRVTPEAGAPAKATATARASATTASAKTASGTTASGTAASATTASATTASGTTVSGTTASGTAVSGTTPASGTAASATTASGTAASATTASATTASGTTASGTPLSGTTVSGTTVSGTTASGTAVSGTAVSGTAASATTASATTASASPAGATDQTSAAVPASTPAPGPAVDAAPVAPSPPPIVLAPKPADPAPRSFHLGISARGHGAFDGRWLGAGSLVIDTGLSSGLGALLDGGVETARSASSAAGSVSAWLAYASVAVRYAIRLGEAWTLTPALGARLFFVSAVATGFTRTSPAQVRVAPAGVLALELQRSLYRGLFVSVSLTGYLRQPQDLVIQGVAEPIDRIEAAGGSLALGLGWNFF